MKKLVVSIIVSTSLVFSFSSAAIAVEQTICFSQNKIGNYPDSLGGAPMYQGTLGDSTTLNGGQCKGKTLPQMNKAGWRVIQIVGGLDSSFGMLLQKGK